MKAELHDHGGCFEFALTPESMAEMAMMAKFAINHTKEIRSIYVYVCEGNLSGSVVLGSRREKRGGLC